MIPISVEGVVMDAQALRNPTHGFFGISYHHGPPRIMLRDFAIPNNASYVGIVEGDWFADICSEDHPLPPKMLFRLEFLEKLNQYMYPLDEAPMTVGNLAWYIVVQPTEGLAEWFVNCTVKGRKFSWHLPRDHEESCPDGCHRIGLWRD